MIPRPKFVVGENVMVRSIIVSDYDIDKTEVIAAEYFDGLIVINDYRRRYTGWRYKTEHQPDKSKWWLEESLVKISDQGKSFDQLMIELNKAGVVSND